MKKYLKSLLLITAVVALVASLAVFASAASSGTCGDNLRWAINYSGRLTISGTGEMYDYESIMHASNSYAPWMSSRLEIKEIVIADGVETIGSYAFTGCSSTTSVTIADSVTKIGDYAFYNCTSIERLDIPSSVETIGTSALSDCDSLTSLTIPDRVTTIGPYAFRDSSKLTSVTIGKGVENIGEGIFYWCKKLTDIEVSEENSNFSSLDGVLFDKDKLTLVQYPAGKTAEEYVIPGGVKVVGQGAFWGTGKLVNIRFPDSATTIKENAFYRCTSLAKMVIPSNVTTVEFAAFVDCDNLAEVYYAGTESEWNATSIEDGNDELTNATMHFGYIAAESVKLDRSDMTLFIGDTKPLVATVLPQNTTDETVTFISSDTSVATVDASGVVTAVGEGVATITVTTVDGGYTATCTVTVGKTDFTYTITDGKVSITDYTGSATELVIPSTINGCPVTEIGRCAFFECESLTRVTIPDNVTKIGDDAFSSCDSLASITIPDGVTEIGRYAFYHCDNLASVTIPDSVKSIGQSAFAYCASLADIALPDSAMNIEKWAFNHTAYFNDSSNWEDGILYIGKHLLLSKGDITSANIKPGTLSIAASAFEDNSKLREVTLPDSIVKIGSNAFKDCDNVEKVSVTNFGEWCEIDFANAAANPLYFGARLYADGSFVVGAVVLDGATRIGSYAFSGYKRLESVEIPSSVAEIANDAFRECTKLEEITIADGVTKIGDWAFCGCENLKSISIPPSVKHIGQRAFLSCENLEEIHITDVGAWCETDFNSAFRDHYETPFGNGAGLYMDGNLLTDIVVPEGTTKVSSYAFCKYEYLKSITLPDSVTEIGNRAFEHCLKLKEVEFGKGLKTIGIAAFKDCVKLVNLELPSGLETIEQNAFEYVAVISLVIPDSIEKITEKTFFDCFNLISVTIPASVKEIEYTAFGACDNLIIYGEKGSAAEEYAEKKGIPFNKEITPVKAITLDKTKLRLVKGKEETLTATLSPSNATHTKVLWESSDESVATVLKGVVTAVGAGEATITAKSLEGGKFATCEVSVAGRFIPITSLKFESAKESVCADDNLTVLDLGSRLTVEPFDHTDTIIWTSSNEKVATVDENGIVTPYSVGSARITAKSVSGGKTAFCSVTVTRSAEGIVLTGDTTIASGETSKLAAYAYYMENGKEKKTKDVISWKSDDPTIVSVTNGTIKGLKVGRTFVTAYVEGTQARESIDVTVTALITNLKFASTKATAYVGNELDLGSTLTATPADYTDTITWTSSNTKVATVDENGVVTAHTTGSAKITAKAGKKSASCTVTVVKEPEAIAVTGATTVAKGKTSKLTAYAYYMENGKEKKTKDTISWRSEDPSIATVSKGTVKGISAGTTNIIAYIEGTDLEEIVEVTVAVPITSIKFASTKATLYGGNEFDLGEKLTFAPAENNDNITWKSSNTKVATVDENGVVTPIATGTAKITATAEAGKKTASCSITVSKAPEGIVVTGSNALAKGKSVTLKAYACYMENGKEKKTKDTISWRSEDPSIVTVSKGKIKGISAGTTNIIAYIEGTDIEEVIEVSVVIPAKTVKLSIKKLTASIGDEFDLNEYLTVTPDDNSDNITWTTSKATVATVEDGIVTIVGKGSAKITAKAVAGGKSASVTITVK